MTKEPYKGSCLCGSIRFEAREFLPRTGNCHCSMCRKFHGAAYATLAEVPKEQFQWTSGQELLKGYTAANGTTRTFCSNCGSSLTFRGPGAADEFVEIALGCFDDEVPVAPDAHIYVASGAHWAVPDDDLPQFEAARDSKSL